MNRMLLLSAMMLASAAAHAGSEVQVTIRSFAFGPEIIEVPAGTTVVWVNKDDEPHTVVSDGKLFHSEALDTNERFSVTFDKPGTYGYFCTLHPHMTGRVVVSGK